MTEAQKKAASDRLKAYHAKKRAEKAAEINSAEQTKAAEPLKPTQIPEQHDIAPETVNDLLNRIKELEAAFKSQPQPQAIQPIQQVSTQHYHAQGYNPLTQRLVGTIEKYVVDPKNYPDPRERLANEPRLARFAFKDNYELEFEVTTTQYETKDGLNMREPRFNLALIKVVYDDNGEKTNGRYTVCKAMFHEDPQTAIVVARENGLEVDEDNQKEFLDEMRYLRMRDWLLEAFYPPKPIQPKKNKKEVVIGNKLVEYFEINSETSETIPFSELKTKV